jgi:glycosyltransferase involved in cell wall biosynthesis
MQTVIHLLPYDGIGGAETAARTMAGITHAAVRFNLRYIFPGVRTRQQRAATFDPTAFLRTGWRIAHEQPDVLIVSLWRSAIVGVMVKLLRPRLKLVVLVHSSKDAHFFDFIFTRLAICASSAVWVDSEASFALRFRRLSRRRVTTISFLAHRLSPFCVAPSVRPSPAFAFWGRLARPKNLGRTIDLFHQIHRKVPEAQLLLIGPDGGVRSDLEAKCASLGLTEAVRFVGPLPHGLIREEIQHCSFYLQTSDYEGMAMSVVEAMQMGLVPVVTPVGEIRRYCQHGKNALTVTDTSEAVVAVLALLNAPAAYERIRDEALATWQQQPLYRDSVLAECMRLAGVRP